MVHLRVVVPKRRTEAVLALLERDHAVTNVIVLPAAALKPAGDVVLCDVARESASIVISDLSGMGCATDGSIAVEHIDTAIGADARRAELRAPGEASDGVLWEEVEQRTSEESVLSATYLAFFVLAAMLAAVGIMLDSPILIVGAMVVGPEFGPLAGICVGLLQRRPEIGLRSVVALFTGFVVAVIAALLLTLFVQSVGALPTDYKLEDATYSELISNPDFFTFVVAFCAGAAGMLSLTTAKSGALVGVLISVTTLPAAANIGVALVYGDSSIWIGSMLQLIANVMTMVVAGTLTLALQRLAYRRKRDHHDRLLGIGRHGSDRLFDPNEQGDTHV